MRREAYNYPIQSTAADVLSLATIRVDQDPWYEEHECYPVLTVHDSLTLECPDEFAEEAARRTLEHFEAVGREYLDWYLPGEAAVGQSWSDWDYEIDMNGERHDKKAA